MLKVTSFILIFFIVNPTYKNLQAATNNNSALHRALKSLDKPTPIIQKHHKKKLITQSFNASVVNNTHNLELVVNNTHGSELVVNNTRGSERVVNNTRGAKREKTQFPTPNNSPVDIYHINTLVSWESTIHFILNGIGFYKNFVTEELCFYFTKNLLTKILQAFDYGNQNDISFIPRYPIANLATDFYKHNMIFGVIFYFKPEILNKLNTLGVDSLGLTSPKLLDFLEKLKNGQFFFIQQKHNPYFLPEGKNLFFNLINGVSDFLYQFSEILELTSHMNILFINLQRAQTTLDSNNRNPTPKIKVIKF